MELFFKIYVVQFKWSNIYSFKSRPHEDTTSIIPKKMEK